MVRIAIPVFEQRVAPRFGFAKEYLLAEIDEGRVEHEENRRFAYGGWHDRLLELSRSGVKVLLCGGFNRRFDPFAEELGMEVVAGLGGPVRVLIVAFANGEELRTNFCIGGHYAWKKSNGTIGRRAGNRRRCGRVQTGKRGEGESS